MIFVSLHTSTPAAPGEEPGLGHPHKLQHLCPLAVLLTPSRQQDFQNKGSEAGPVAQVAIPTQHAQFCH